jgi:hypothetical protein
MTTATSPLEVASKSTVSLASLKRGTRLIVGTSRGECQIVVLCPEENLVMVWGYDPRLTGIIARIDRSVYGGGKRRAFRRGCISFNMQMELRFKNHTLLCPPTVSLRVEGDGWFYDVF